MRLFQKSILIAVVFLSAFLLFVSEPLIGRLLLPFLGGAAHVWLICLMFFQAMLLIGYLYAHLIAPKIGVWHLALLLLPFINLPFKVTSEPNIQSPFSSLFFILLTRFGLPFIVLSTTVVVTQSWLSRSLLREDYEPYPLYAASNAGSLLGLLSYAFIIEPGFGVKAQTLLWMIFYVLFILLMAFARYVLKMPPKGEQNHVQKPYADSLQTSPGYSKYITWLLLSSLPSALLLAVTNFVSMEIGSFPMIWVIPLSLYLLSFVVTFRTKGGVPKLLRILWPEVLLLAFVFYFVSSLSFYTIFGCFLVFCLICISAHGKLYETRPPTRWLTNFYLTTAIGGFLGGASVSLLTPLIFNRYLEYPILLLCLLAILGWLRDVSFKQFWVKASRVLVTGRVIIVALLLFILSLEAMPSSRESVKYRHRNFYGTYRIFDVRPSDPHCGNIRILAHGKTMHGAQLLDPDFQSTPVAYYFKGGGISDVYEMMPKSRRMAVIGLGAGVVCTYAEQGETLTFFEIDPDNYHIAKNWFTFLNQCKGNVNVIHGDGRLSLQKAIKAGSRYDIIFIDAFSGDGIPFHLLTQEALEIYLDGLAEDGVILFNISNRYYHLRPVIKATASMLDLSGVVNNMAPKWKLEGYQTPPNCVVLAKNAKRLQALIDQGWIMFSKKDGLGHARPWTDDYIDVISPLADILKNVGLLNTSKFKI
jgi:spermidine synthase